MAVITNRATLRYNDVVTSSNLAVGRLLEVLTASKTALAAGYAQGDTVAYVVTLVNSGSTALTGLTVTDDLGGYALETGTVYPLRYQAGTLRYYVNGTLQAAPTVTAGPPLTVTGVEVPAGGDVTLAYQTTVTEYAPGAAESTIENTVTVTGGGLAAPVTAAATLGTQGGPVLSILKSLSPDPVAENGRLTYTFTLQNTGNTAAEAADAAVITDIFSPILRNLTVTFNGTAWTAPDDYTYDQTTGTFATVAGELTVPAASYARDAATGAWVTTPGTATLIVAGDL